MENEGSRHPRAIWSGLGIALPGESGVTGCLPKHRQGTRAISSSSSVEASAAWRSRAWKSSGADPSATSTSPSTSR
eukprot:1436438-Rhodomonas_salina.1